MNNSSVSVISYSNKRVGICIENDKVNIETIENADVVIIIDRDGIFIKVRKNEKKDPVRPSKGKEWDYKVEWEYRAL